MKRQTVVLVALAVPLLCAGIVGITMVAGVFRSRQTTDAEPRFVGSASWTNPVPASPAASPPTTPLPTDTLSAPTARARARKPERKTTTTTRRSQTEKSQ